MVSIDKIFRDDRLVFNLRRYFSLASAAVIIVATVVLSTFYRQHAMNELIEITGSQNVTLAKSLANSVWPQFSAFVTSISEHNADELAIRSETTKMQKVLKKIAANLPVLKVKIYNIDGLIVYSSEPSEMGEDRSNNPRFLRVTQGEAVSQLSHRKTFSAFSGTVKNRDLVETYIPIYDDNGKRIAAVFELYTDVTPLVTQVGYEMIEVVVMLVLSFGFMYGCLFLIVWRADLILKEEVAERKQAQHTIEEQNRELMDLAGEYEEAKNVALEAKNIALAANRTKSEFLANMSHELRTPLNAVIGFSEIMMNGTNGQLSDKHKEYANDIFDSGHHLLTLINDILDLSKIEAGKTEVYPVNVSISSIFKACIGFIAERAQEKIISVEVKTSCDDLYVYADPLRLKQIILNLLSNSVKFTDMNGSINIRCTVGDNVIISVEDNGMGMDEEGLKSALTKFGQVNSGLDREQEGTGLGLPLSIELAELMGGSIDIVSELEIGTTVTVTLPKAR